MVCPLRGGSVGLSWAVGGASVGLSLWRRLFHSRVGRICVPLQEGGILESISWGKGSVYHYFREFAPVSCGGGGGSLHLPSWRGVCLSVFLRGRSGRRGLPVPDSHCLLSPGQLFHLRTRLSLGPRPPAASRSGFRRPTDGRPWRRLRALRLPRLPRWLRLPWHPRMLNVPAQLWRSQRPLAPAPKDLTLCLRRPLPQNWTSLHLSIMVIP